MSHRFEPLLDAGQQVVRQALPGEYALQGANLIFNASDAVSQGKYAIYRRVPHDPNRPSDRLVERFREAAHQIGNLFCWCVENLSNMPPMKGDFLDEVKRRLKEHEDTSCEVAFARMCAAWRVADGSKLNVCETYLAKCELEKRFLSGESSLELTALMVQLTERMKGST